MKTETTLRIKAEKYLGHKLVKDFSNPKVYEQYWKLWQVERVIKKLGRTLTEAEEDLVVKELFMGRYKDLTTAMPPEGGGLPFVSQLVYLQYPKPTLRKGTTAHIIISFLNIKGASKMGEIITYLEAVKYKPRVDSYAGDYARNVNLVINRMITYGQIQKLKWGTYATLDYLKWKRDKITEYVVLCKAVQFHGMKTWKGVDIFFSALSEQGKSTEGITEIIKTGSVKDTEIKMEDIPERVLDEILELIELKEL